MGFKGWLVAGTILILQPWNSIPDPANQATVSWTHVPQRVEQIWEKYQNDVASLLNMLNSDSVNPQDLQQQVLQITQDLNQLHRGLRGEVLARHMGIHHLPRKQSTGAKHTAGIDVIPGDPGVSSRTANLAAQIVQNVALPVLQHDLGQQPSAAHIVLFSTKNSYAAALRQAGVQSRMIPQIVANTGGITVGSDVWIPLYALQDDSDLANVLTHELTHVVLNQMGIGDQLPTWINEGIAWVNGLQAQNQINPSKAAQEEQALNQQLHAAAAQGKLLPLSASENEILQASYNVEWQDYLAVQQLLQTYGVSTFRAFLQDAVSKGLEESFRLHYQTTLQQYESQAQTALAAGLAGH